MDPLRDAPKVLEFTDDNGYTIQMERDGVHHFYYLKDKKGKPVSNSAYTNYEAAKLAIDHIFEDRRKNKKAA